METDPTSKNFIDIDDQSTWPEGVKFFVASLFKKYILDKNQFLINEDEQLIPLFKSQPLLTYHATRLLPHEIMDIKNNGLQILTRELVRKKIDDAVNYGYLTQEIGTELLQNSILWRKRQTNRENQVCLVLGGSPFRNSAPGLRLLFGIWGGEAINMTVVGNKYRALLSKIGEAVVLKVHLPLDTNSNFQVHPSITLSFMKAFKKEGPVCDLLWREGTIHSKHILEIFSPKEMLPLD